MSHRDGIAQPWGTRTPYGSGGAWPVRVDSNLVDGVGVADVDTWVRSAAVLHSNGDGLDIAVKNGRIVGVRGRADDRVNRGRLDPKDLFRWSNAMLKTPGELRRRYREDVGLSLIDPSIGPVHSAQSISRRQT